MSLSGKVCLVTGATRGIGRGIALQLGAAGATIYITGRTLKKTGDLPGSLEETVKEVEERGGSCIPIQCDHTKDDQVKAVFDKINSDQDGQLDLLVNNAFSAVTAMNQLVGKPFWEYDDDIWDVVNNVGLRNHYQCTVHAARLMTARKQGLIVNISSIGGLRYLFAVPYGIGKAAKDRMAVDCAHELRRHKVAMVSLWPGPAKTELITEMLAKAERVADRNRQAQQMQKVFSNAESTEFSGKIIAALVQDPKLMSKSGRILMTADLGQEYGITDLDGNGVRSMRSVRGMMEMAGWTRTASYIPEFIRIPYFMLTLAGSKF